ncbi:Superfamily II DNA and RNA helicases [gamma proteobacterium HdN1]|nr:Superfamily II DNA and RNA helicases [gamma proteobacterium HdN1]
MPSNDFASLLLPPHLVENLRGLGYSQMTPIQAQALPPILDGADVIAQSKTGSGKTAAFGIGVLTSLNPRFFGTQALVLCPTRELADQVAKELRRLARSLQNIKILTLCGGTAIGPQFASLEHGAHIIVGTPGRVTKHLDKGSLDLQGLKTLVLDEADRMLDMGFYDQIAEIARFIPKRRQTLLFSATYTPAIRELSRNFQSNPVEITVESVHADSEIEQYFYEVDHKQRRRALSALLKNFKPESAVLFCNTKQLCDEVADALNAQGFYAQTLHGDMEQRDRDLVLLKFSNRSCPYLVATDVAARGLDIKDLAAVVNVDVAFDPDVHIHRIGRTGRAGQKGLALSLCSPAEVQRANAIETLLGRPLHWRDLPPSNDNETPEPPRMVTLNIGGGKRDKLRPGDILGALTGDAGLPGASIGKIDIGDQQTYVAVERAIAQKAVKRLQSGKIKGRSYRVRIV